MNEVFVTKIQSLPRNGATLTSGSKGSALFVLDVEDNGVCWTELSGEMISLRKIQLSNIGGGVEIVSVHNVQVTGRSMLIVVTKVVSRSSQSEDEAYTFEHYSKPYHLYTYLVEREEEIVEWNECAHVSYDVSLTPLQVFPTEYRPLSICYDSHMDTPFLFASGSDNLLHAYEIDMQTLKVHRSPLRDGLRLHWENRLSFDRNKSSNASLDNVSLPLCLLLERETKSSSTSSSSSSSCSVGVIGYSSGLLSMSSHTRDGTSFGRVLLMDSAITCLAGFNLTPDRDGELCSHVVIGLAEGAAVLGIESAKSEPVMIMNARKHGFVKAIAAGDLTNSGQNDILLGFEDGTVLCFSCEGVEEDPSSLEVEFLDDGWEESGNFQGKELLPPPPEIEIKIETETDEGDDEGADDVPVSPPRATSTSLTSLGLAPIALTEGDEEDEEEEEEEKADEEEKEEEEDDTKDDNEDQEEGVDPPQSGDEGSSAPPPPFPPRRAPSQLRLRETWRTWLPFPVCSMAFSDHMQVPLKRLNASGELEEVPVPQTLSVITNKTLHVWKRL